MFADDTNLFFSDFNLSNLVKTANCELDKIFYWFKLNKLSLNIKKTNFILFILHVEDIVINIDNIKIEQAVNTKFLGVIINQALSWNEHIQTIKNKINKNIGIIRKIKQSVPQSVLIMLYNTVIHPYLSYCDIVWALHRTTFLDSLNYLSLKKGSSVNH